MKVAFSPLSIHGNGYEHNHKSAAYISLLAVRNFLDEGSLGGITRIVFVLPGADDPMSRIARVNSRKLRRC